MDNESKTSNGTGPSDLPLNRQKRSGDPALQDLANVRHSLAHLLAAAVERLYPTVKRAIGPAIENGFYYDFEFAEPISDKDLGRIEKEMRKTLATWSTFTRHKKSPDEAREYFKGNPYKLELIDKIVGKGEGITFYESSPYFTDLCRGGHADDMSAIAPDSFVLSRIAGAYWRGDEKNAMLTRIYGLAFENKAELDAYLTQQEEAKKRDHRKLGRELELFTLIDEIGPGLPLFYPNGAILRRVVERFIEDEQEKRGYVPIWIPHITKGELYRISGHLDKYDAMYTPMKVDDEDYYLKPMNCPHFMMLYRSLPHSYRELPLRYTCTTTNYRYEKSGELSGLTRVRSLTQDDCHVFTTPEKIEDEITLMLEMIGVVYKKFGFTDFWVRISLRDSTNKSGYLGSDDVWEKSENALRSVVKATGWRYEEAEGEAAFYGPKLDFMFKDAIGRQWQLSTIQLDWNLPERFELEYADSAGNKSRPVVIHRAILGSTERFLGVMIEHFGGAFPLFLSPVQGVIIPVSEHHVAYAQGVLAKLRAEGFRIEVDLSNETLGKKIRENKIKKAPYLFVVGEKETENDTVSVESRDEGSLGAMNISDLILQLKKEQG